MTRDPDIGKRVGIPRTTILLLAGALILIGHEAWFGGGDSPGGSSAKAAVVAVDSRVGPTRSKPVSRAVSEEAVSFAGWPPPPRPAHVAAPTPPTIDEIRLERIVFEPGDREASFAVISGWAVRAGERAGELRVAAIEADRVIFDDGTELRLP